MQNRVTAIVGGKGGGGKTMYICNMLYRLILDDPTAILIDLDYPQHTSYKFFVERRQFNGLKPLNIIKMEPKNLNRETILKIALDHKNILLEYGKGIEDSMKWVMSFADELKMILQPTAFEHESIGDIEIEFHKFGNKEIPCSIVSNRVTNVSRYNNWVKTEPKPTYFKFSENYISDLRCYSDSAGEGRSIFEWSKTSKQIVTAYREMELQYKETFKW